MFCPLASFLEAPKSFSLVLVQDCLCVKRAGEKETAVVHMGLGMEEASDCVRSYRGTTGTAAPW